MALIPAYRISHLDCCLSFLTGLSARVLNSFLQKELSPSSTLQPKWPVWSFLSRTSAQTHLNPSLLSNHTWNQILMFLHIIQDSSFRGCCLTLQLSYLLSPFYVLAILNYLEVPEYRCPFLPLECLFSSSLMVSCYFLSLTLKWRLLQEGFWVLYSKLSTSLCSQNTVFIDFSGTQTIDRIIIFLHVSIASRLWIPAFNYSFLNHFNLIYSG